MARGQDATPGIELDGKDLLVSPPTYPSKEVKDELGGRWDKGAQAWVLPPTSLNVLKLAEWYGEDFIRTAPDFIQDLAFEEWGFTRWDDEERAHAEAHPDWSNLYPYQKEAVEYCVANPHNCALLGLSPGLGKTVVSIVTADLVEAKRILILAPVSLTKNWQREIDKWSASHFDVHLSRAPKRTVGPEVTVANHEVVQEIVLRDEDGEVTRPDWVRNAKRVKEWVEDGPTEVNDKGKRVPKRRRITQAARQFADVDWDLIICDESLVLKNRKAVKTDVLSTLVKRAERVLLLSGSPTSKYNDDLFRQLQIMFPRGFKSYWRFAEQFCVVNQGVFGWSIDGNRPDVDPKHYLRDFMLMVDQEDVLPDLPDYITKAVPVEFTKRQQRAYETMLEEWVVELEAQDPKAPALEDEDLTVYDSVGLETSSHLGQMTRLQQITSNMGTLPKVNAAGEPTGEFYARSSAKEDLLVSLIKEGEIEMPLLVWAWWVPTAKSISQRLAKEFKDLSVGLVVGADSAEDKDATIECYKGGDLDVLILQMNVGKYGHTLTNTRTVFYHDRSFDADAWVQSLRRVRRIGLEHVPVLYLPQIPGSADELIELNLLGKIASISKLTNESLLTLLRNLMLEYEN